MTSAGMRKPQTFKYKYPVRCYTQQPHTGAKMAPLLLLMMMLTACAATPQDLSGKMMTFPEETATANVRLEIQHYFSAVTVCFRSFTDLSRQHSLFSLATPSSDNGFLIFKSSASDLLETHVLNKRANFRGLGYKLNMWNIICSTWDSSSGLLQLWLDGKPSIRKYLGGSNITNANIVLGQEQDSFNGGFDANQSFFGMIADVHMWDYVLSACDIDRYVNDLNFSPGNVVNWRALDFQITGRVLIEDKQLLCH